MYYYFLLIMYLASFWVDELIIKLIREKCYIFRKRTFNIKELVLFNIRLIRIDDVVVRGTSSYTFSKSDLKI